MPARFPRPLEAETLVHALLVALERDPAAVTQKGMAPALGIRPRTLSRWLHALGVAWPPVERAEWERRARQAEVQAQLRAAETQEWLLTCRVSADTLRDVETLVARERITILKVERLSRERTSG